MILNFEQIKEIVNLQAACDAAQEATYETSQVAFDAKGTPLEAAANAAWEAESEALDKVQEALAEAKLREMVAAIKAALEAASVDFTVDMHSFTVYARTAYPWDIPGATFRFPGHDDLALEAHEIFDEEDEELHYSFGLGVEVRGVNVKAYGLTSPYHWSIHEDLDELISKVVDHLAERRAN